MISAFMPAVLIAAFTHSAHFLMSGVCSERALTLGMRSSSNNSSCDCLSFFARNASRSGASCDVMAVDW